ncbi:uncharacterized protein [Centruroides vittatus]|uniref:uncharacterized protein n=1 Tax=Centruroides vittatus TaxID=120091 RepID=UPI00350F425E
MNGNTVKVEKSIKYLGVILEHRLLWNDHVSYINNRTGKIFNTFAGLAKRKWGLASEALDIIYRQIFIPIATYACGSWGHDVNKVHICRKLIAAQRRALVQITKAYCTTPNASLQVLARTPPLPKVVQFYTKLWYVKWGRNVNIKDQTIYANEFERPVQFSLTRHPAELINIQFATTGNVDLEIYTDGSKSEAKVGCSFVAFYEGTEIEQQQFRLGARCSSFQAELFAICMAVIWCKNNHPHLRINIITDCASAIASLKKNNLHPLVYDIQNIVNSSSCHFTITWIKGHLGHHGNERADTLAKEASNNTELPIVYNNFSIQSIKSSLWEDTIDKWQLDWDNNTSITHQLIPVLSKFLTNKWYSPSHKISQMLSNHGRFFAYLSRFKGITSPMCAICDNTDGSIHYIFQCPMLEAERCALKIIADSHNINWPPSNLVDLITHKDAYDAFIRLVNMYFIRTTVPAFVNS